MGIPSGLNPNPRLSVVQIQAPYKSVFNNNHRRRFKKMMDEGLKERSRESSLNQYSNFNRSINSSFCENNYGLKINQSRIL